MKKIINQLIIISFITSLGISGVMSDIHLTSAVTPSNTISNRSLNMGITFNTPIDDLAIGVEWMTQAWKAKEFYAFEEELLIETQSVGKTEEYKKHQLFGFSPIVNWEYKPKITNKSSSFFMGAHIGFPNTPNGVWFESMGKITDRYIVSPFIRMHYPLLQVKYLPEIVWAPQVSFVQNAGLIASFQFGIQLNR